VSYRQHQIELWKNEAQTLIEWGCNRVGMGHLIPHIHIRFRENKRSAMGTAFTNFGIQSQFSTNWVQEVLGSQAEPGGMIAFNVALYERVDAAERKRNILHELAHILANIKLGKRAGHRHHWKEMMRSLGQEPQRCHKNDTSDLKRKQQQYKLHCPDRCGWDFIFAAARRTRRINQLRQRNNSKCYFCPKCKASIKLEHWINAQEVAA